MVAFPLLLIPLAVYNIVIVMMPTLQMTQPVIAVPLKSGALWSVTSGDILIALAVVLLLLEMLKAARPGGKTLVEILLSILLCGGAIAEFVLYAPFATSVFFLLIVVGAVDVLGSIAISAKSRRRPVRDVSRAPAARSDAQRVEPTIVDPEPDNMQQEAILQDNAHHDHADAERSADAPRRSPYSPDGVTTP